MAEYTVCDENVEDVLIELNQMLMELIASGVSNKHDHVIVGIEACIWSGIRTGPKIIQTLSRVGLSSSHIAIILHTEAGSDPARHRWERDNGGYYTTHN